MKLTCTEEKFLLNDDELHPRVALIPGARTVVTSVFLDNCLDTQTTYSADKFFLGKRALFKLLVRLASETISYVHTVPV